MDKDWFPFFSMFFWWVTKVAGLIMFLLGLYALGSLFLMSDGWFSAFWRLLFMAALPTAIGAAILRTDFLYEIATGAMNARRRVG